MLILLGALCSAAPAQELADENPSFVINLRDADIRALAEQVSEITGRTLVLDPTITGDVTVISAEELTQQGVWDLFQSILRVQGFAALRSGTIWRVVPQAVVREGGGELGDGPDAGRFDVVTRLIQLDNFPSATAVAALRPLVASFGYIEALPETNTLVVTDTVENVDRIEAIARTLDEGDGTQLSTIPVRHVDASEIASALTRVLGAEGGLAMRVAIDARNNVLLVRGSPELTDRVRVMVAELDQPGRQPPALALVTRVYRLRYADAASLAEVLRGVVGLGGEATVQNAVAESLFAPASVQEPSIANGFEVPPEAEAAVGETRLSFERPPVTSLAAEDISIQPAVEINAVVIRARAEVHNDLAQLVAQLDQRRPQVLIEAAIAEISGDIAEQLGVQLGLGDAATDATFAATSFPESGLALKNILTLLRVPVAPALTPNGLSIGLSTEDEYGILIQALAQSTKANLLSTPSITTLDNQEARILVGQNVPFRTGSFTLDGDAQNPFDTIERQDIGVILRVVPQVSQGDSVQLAVSQEVSSISNQNVPDAADIITNRRLIETTVVADNGGTIVLGGLITDDRTTARSGIPGLGDVPFVGRFFSSTGENATKRVLFVFLRPTILRTRAEIGTVSNERFQRLRSIEAQPARAADLLAEPRPIRKLPLEINGLY
jgi:general secretion pathway protein D